MEAKLQINGQTVRVKEGTTVMRAAEQLGLYIPHFCYHKKLSIAANCRMCMVDIERAPKPVPACATPVVDGMVVHTDSERAKKAQHAVMEFLLINHPLDCPICDQGGECQLQDLAVGYGISRSRYTEEKRVVFEKNLGPLISTDMTRCIHCTRCVRFGTQVAGVMELGMTGRGEHAEIMPFVEKTVDSELSGNMIDVCPVGALTSKPFRYTARPWELARREVVGAHDSWGSHLSAHIKEAAVKRVVPSTAAGVFECWISDRDRFSYEGLGAPDRLRAPMMREAGARLLQDTSWARGLARLTDGVRAAAKRHGAERVGFFVSPRATCEEAFLLGRIARHLGVANVDFRLQRRDFTGGDVAGLGLQYGDIAALKTALFVGAEPGRELPLLAAELRQKVGGGAGRKKYFSLSAVDIGGELPLADGLLSSPARFAELFVRTAVAAGVAPPPGWNAKGDLFEGGGAAAAAAEKAAEEKTVQAAAAALKEAGENGVVWFGDIARASPNYGLLLAVAGQLAAAVGCRVGVLDDGANGMGARRVGALPGEGGLDAAAMLRGDLQAVVLLRCEAADFAEQALAEKMLAAAEFTAAITPFSRGAGGADVLLPAADFCETGGTYINGWGERAAFAAAAAAPGEARPAWKIFRRWGEMLGVDGFDFDDLEQLQAWMWAELDGGGGGQKFAALPAATYEPPDGAAKNGGAGEFSRCGGAAPYGGDMLLRRAASLQKTSKAKAADCIALHPDALEKLGVADNGRVVVGDGENEWSAPAIADARIAPGTARFWSPAIAAGEGLTLRAESGGGADGAADGAGGGEK